MNIFDQYGIKEVADVTIYSIHKKEDGSGDVYYVPALYLDTLKVTTTEKTAENTWAQGGLGNSRLISWDYGKTINLTLEDALCTPASLGLCWGGILSADWKDGQIDHRTGMQSLDCSAERISRMEKAFFPRNDGTVVSELLPRDGKEDMLEDINGDKIILQRSSVLDGTNVKGFGYLDGKPYKWHLEIESAVKSVAVVPDRFFSIYGKSYPIKRRQTVGINQPSEAFKYEIIYLRGYDKYNDETPCARIIYHKQMEQGEVTKTCTSADDALALALLNDAENYPYLKIRVCWDGSIRAYLGTKGVDWDSKRTIEKYEEDYSNSKEESISAFAQRDSAWTEIPQINTDQFRDIDLWVRFDSLNALSYYLITKYENNIYNIGPKIINTELPTALFVSKINIVHVTALGGSGWPCHIYMKDGKKYIYTPDQSIIPTTEKPITYELTPSCPPTEALYKLLVEYKATPYAGINSDILITDLDVNDIASVAFPGLFTFEITYENAKGETVLTEQSLGINSGSVSYVVGKDYSLDNPSWVTEAEKDDACTPCCKKDNMSRGIWAYVNPKTMTPFDDDYWFHQGEPYYKKSLTLSTGQNPLKAQKIFVEQGVFPGMYKIVAETLIRERDTGEDQRVQITLPLCKIKSDQTLTLQADGDPTTFNLDVEVATPKNGIPMEITFYEVEKDMKKGCSGNSVPKDGSTKISAKK